ncbi:helix-turn-helix domain-containing protein [Geodermatophilus normandii]|uniref:Winged helix-turn-helix transcriptional regulator n=1 Tax=Geodermatophilus normandii TaxID=1137989 RepID=A0A6P0GHZ1_9ACTN|nr:winged helix-turn-helix transcriptional regulator [Geodermatophilus normandii]
MPLSADWIARFAGVLADRTRVSMCLAMLDGRAWTAAELARHAAVARSTASEHLTSLVSAGVLVGQRQGRSRSVQLAGPEVAAALEDLGALAGERVRPTSLRTARAQARLAEARTCYDHLAGHWAVTVFDTLVARGLLAIGDGLTVTAAGRRWFTDVCGDVLPGRRPLVRTCLDRTERRSHLGGALGAALLRTALAEGWVSRVAALPRALAVSPAGAGAGVLADLPAATG